MNLMNTPSEEQQWQDKLLGHTFDFEPEAWKDMEALLDKKDRIPGAVPPPNGGGRMLGVQIALALLLASGITGAAYWIFKPMPAPPAAPPAQADLHIVQQIPAETVPAISPYKNEEKQANDNKNDAPSTNSNLSTLFFPSSSRHAARPPVEGFTELPTTTRAGMTAETKENTGDAQAGQAIAQEQANTIGSSSTLQVPAPYPALPTITTLRQPASAAKGAPAITISPVIVTAEPLPIIRKAPEKRFYFGLLAGADAPVPQQFSNPIAVRPYGGLSAEYRLSERWGLLGELTAKVGGPYNLAATLNLTNILPSGAAYGTVAAQASNFLYIEMPLLAQYQIRHRLTALAGFRPAYIHVLDVQTSQSSVQIYGNFDPSLADESSKLASSAAFISAVRKFDMGVSMGMEYRFARRWSAGLRWTQGFLDLTADNIFQQQSDLLNSDIQLWTRFRF